MSVSFFVGTREADVLAIQIVCYETDPDLRHTTKMFVSHTAAAAGYEQGVRDGDVRQGCCSIKALLPDDLCPAEIHLCNTNATGILETLGVVDDCGFVPLRGSSDADDFLYRVQTAMVRLAEGATLNEKGAYVLGELPRFETLAQTCRQMGRPITWC